MAVITPFAFCLAPAYHMADYWFVGNNPYKSAVNYYGTQTNARQSRYFDPGRATAVSPCEVLVDFVANRMSVCSFLLVHRTICQVSRNRGPTDQLTALTGGCFFLMNSFSEISENKSYIAKKLDCLNHTFLVDSVDLSSTTFT